MATSQQRRMVYAQLAENMPFAKMSDKAQKVYIFMIVLADDDGRLKGNSEWLRIKIFPYNTDITVSDMKGYIQEIVKAGLITWYRGGDDYFIQHPNWGKYQILRSDRKRDSDIPPPTDNQLTTNDGLREEKRREVKRREVKRTREVASDPLAPVNVNRDFFKLGKTYADVAQEFLDRGMHFDVLDRELKKFVLYWTEKNKSGTKERWEQQETFDVRRRMLTWLNRIAEQGVTTEKSKGKEIISAKSRS